MILLSVINLSVVSHLCQGKVIAVKISLSDQPSYSCCMDDHDGSSSGTVFKNHCCANESTSLKVDRDYSPSYSKSPDVFQKEIHHPAILLGETFKSATFTGKISHTFSPPDNIPMHSVEQADICVFRI